MFFTSRHRPRHLMLILRANYTGEELHPFSIRYDNVSVIDKIPSPDSRRSKLTATIFFLRHERSSLSRKYNFYFYLFRISSHFLFSISFTLFRLNVVDLYFLNIFIMSRFGSYFHYRGSNFPRWYNRWLTVIPMLQTRCIFFERCSRLIFQR